MSASFTVSDAYQQSAPATVTFKVTGYHGTQAVDNGSVVSPASTPIGAGEALVYQFSEVTATNAPSDVSSYVLSSLAIHRRSSKSARIRPIVGEDAPVARRSA